MQKQYLDICGCCVSRDTIEFSNDQQLGVSRFIHFSSPLALATDSVLDKDFVHEDELQGETQFLKRCIVTDWLKTAFEQLKATSSKWLLMDIGHIRYDLGKLTRKSDGASSYITYSREAKEDVDTFFGKEAHPEYLFEVIHHLSIPDNQLTELLKSFSDRILNIYKPENIILLETYLCEYYLDETEKLCVFESSNISEKIFFQKCHQMLKEMLAGCRVIKFPSAVMANERHKWNKYPLHYVYDYYIYAYEAVRKIVIEGASDKELEEFYREYEMFFDRKFRAALTNLSQDSKRLATLQGMLKADCSINAPKIKYGGMSGNSFYDCLEQRLFVAGWLLPRYAYDEVRCYSNGEFLGKARLNVERKDVEQHYKYYVDAVHSGFVLECLGVSALPEKITIQALRDGEIVFQKNYDIAVKNSNS